MSSYRTLAAVLAAVSLSGVAFAQTMTLNSSPLNAEARISVVARPSTIPTPVTRSVSLALRPGEALPVIHTYAGNTTNLVFADSTGVAWPVLSVTTDNPAAFKVDQVGPPGTSHMVIISPLQQYAHVANLMVTLVGNPVPITMALQSDGATVDFRVDIGLLGRGPNATTKGS